MIRLPELANAQLNEKDVVLVVEDDSPAANPVVKSAEYVYNVRLAPLTLAIC